MTITVNLEPPWKMHAGQYQLLRYPPNNIEFVHSELPSNSLYKKLTSAKYFNNLIPYIDSFIPTMLVKSALQKTVSISRRAALTYAVDHLVFRNEPWVVEIEYATMLVGLNNKYLTKYKRTIEKSLGSINCKHIVCWSQAGINTLIDNLDTSSFRDKISLIHYASPKKEFIKKYDNSKIKLLYIGTGTSKASFYGRAGGIFDIFDSLCSDYNNLELVVRSYVPPEVKSKYSHLHNIKIIDDFIPRDKLETELKTSDIFLIPSYGSTPITILEAMSYELPVVTIDTWANPEYVTNNVTGIVAARSEILSELISNSIQPFFASNTFQEYLNAPDHELLNNLELGIRLLIDRPELRKQYGKAGRFEVDYGNFSLTLMNQKLEKILSQASQN